MYVNPGELNKKIQIINMVSPGVNSNGFPLPVEEKVILACWAKVTSTSGTEIVKANSEFAQAKKRFLIRFTETEINTDMVIRYREKDYNIRYINTYGDSKEYIEIWTDLEERV